MTTQLRATGLSEEQRDALAKELEGRGIGGWESVGEPREIVGDGDEATYGPQKFELIIPVEGETDVASLGGWLDKQFIAHALEQPKPASITVPDEPEVPDEPAAPETQAPRDAVPPPAEAPADDDTKEQKA